jgi:hypothetical protein
VLLAGSAGTRIVAADLGGAAHEGFPRMVLMMAVIVPVVAIRAVYVAVLTMLVKDGVGLGL